MKRIKKGCIIILIVIVGLTRYCNIYAKEKTKKEKTNEIKNVKNIDTIRKKENIVFLGDSITDYYPTNEIFAGLPIVNSGVAGYKTTDILDRIESMVTQYNPTSVYILIGTNDIIHNKEEEKEQAINNIKKIVENIKKDRKHTKIYIESLLPINRVIDPTEYYVGDRENSTIQEINTDILNYCKDNNYTYIDIYNELTDENGNFSKKYTNDGLHPNDLGYAIITRELLTYIYNMN